MCTSKSVFTLNTIKTQRARGNKEGLHSAYQSRSRTSAWPRAWTVAFEDDQNELWVLLPPSSHLPNTIYPSCGQAPGLPSEISSNRWQREPCHLCGMLLRPCQKENHWTKMVSLSLVLKAHDTKPRFNTWPNCSFDLPQKCDLNQPVWNFLVNAKSFGPSLFPRGRRSDLHDKTLALGLPGGPVVKTPGFHCRGRRFDPWCRN